MVLVLVLSALLVACGATIPDPGPQFSPLATEQVGGSSVSVLPTAVMPLPTAAAGRPGMQLVLLHTNDNWGETEPCG